MRRRPPWRWPVWGPWPPEPTPPPTEAEIRARAHHLAELRPWCTAEQNWIDAQQELESPLLLRWRPTLLRWLGASEKTGWDWMDLSLKLSVPLTIVFLGSLLGSWNNDRQNQIAQNNQKDSVLRDYIRDMKGILLDEDVAKEVKQIGSEQNSLARALAVIALAQLKGEQQERRDLLFQFLRESKLPILGGDNKHKGTNLSFADLRRTNLKSADLRRTDIRKADLSSANLPLADLRGADLRQADLSWAYLHSADLRGADLRGADLSGADLTGIKWNKETRWPGKEALEDSQNIPPRLKQLLGLP